MQTHANPLHPDNFSSLMHAVTCTVAADDTQGAQHSLSRGRGNERAEGLQDQRCRVLQGATILHGKDAVHQHHSTYAGSVPPELQHGCLYRPCYSEPHCLQQCRRNAEGCSSCTNVLNGGCWFAALPVCRSCCTPSGAVLCTLPPCSQLHPWIF